MAGFTWVSVCFCFSPLSGAVTMFFFGSLRSEKIVVNLHPPKTMQDVLRHHMQDATLGP